MSFNLKSVIAMAGLRAATVALLTVAAAMSPVHAQTASNTATVAAPAGVSDPNTANNSATDTDTVVAPLLSLAKTHVGNFTVGANGVYTLTLSNTGTAPTTGTVTVVDTLPAGLTYVSGTGTGWSCSAAAQVVTCTSTTAIANGASGSPITLTVAAAAAASPSVTNTARASGGGDATCPASGANQTRCNASDPTNVNNSADVSVTKTDGTATYVPGGTLAYTVVVGNAGPSAAVNVVVVDNAPAGSTITSWTCTGAACPAASGTGNVNQTIASLPASGSVTYLINVAVASGSTGNFTNTATANSATTPDPTPGNNSASDTDTAAASSDVSITKTLTSASPALPGGAVSWTIVASNAGPSNGTVNVSDTVPTSVTGLTIGGADAASCTVVGQVVSCAFGSVAAGQTRTFTISGTLSLTATGTLANTATVTTGSNDPNGGNNSSTSSTPIGTAALLSVVKAGPASVVAGASYAYTLTLSNAGQAATGTNLIVQDQLPAGVVATAVTGANCGTLPSAAGALLTCTVPGPIAGGANTVVTLTVTAPATGGPIVNYAAVNPTGIGNPGTPPGPGCVPSATTSCSSASTTVNAPQLSLAKTHTGNFTVGTDATFTVTVSNTGAAPTTGTITIQDTLPAGLTFVSGAGTGWACSAAGQVGTCTSTTPIAAGAAGNPITLVVAVAAAAVPSITNVARAGGGGDATCPTPPGATPTPAARCSASDTATVNASIDAVNDPTFTTPSTGGATATSVTANDVVNGQPATLGVGGNATITNSVLDITPATGSITLSATTGLVTVAANTTPGTYVLTYTLCVNPATTPATCDTATQTIVVTAVIDAVDDGPTTIPSTGGSTPTVVANDTVNGQAATLGAGGNATLIPGTSPNAGLTMSATTGIITVAPGTAPGTYQYPYQLCVNPATTPATCDNAIATVIVGATIDAVNDPTFTTPSTGGATATSVTANDVVNGQPATLGVGGNATITNSVLDITPATGSITLSATTGLVTVAANTTPGTYVLTYTLCVNPATTPATCDTATQTIVVTAVIDAVDDGPTTIPSTGGSTPTVVANDTVNGQAATLGAGGNATLIPGTSPNAGLTMSATTGIITVAPGTAPGTYQYPYQLCVNPATTPATCDNAIATVIVGATIDAVNDPTFTTPSTGGATATSVTANDVVNGQPATLGVGGNATITASTLDITPATGSITLSATTGLVTVAPNTTPGTYVLTYTLCVNPATTPATCDTATITIVVTATIDAVNDDFSATPVNGATGGTTATVITNDTVNGQVATLGVGGNATLIPGASPNAGLTMNAANGVITVAPGTPAGTYQYPYQICVNPATTPATCDNAIATVVVVSAVILANDDTQGPVNGATGGTTPTVVGNDTLNGQPVTVGAGGNSTLTPGTSPNAGLTMNPDGTITVAPGTAAGTYLYPYTICEVLNPTNCDTAIATVTVNAATIDAVDDNFAATPVNGAAGGTTATVITNDTLNGQPVTVGAGGNSTLTPGTSPNAGLTMNPDGTITVAPGTAAGTYLYPYTICEVLNPTNCDTATATVVVAAGTIVAVDDTPAPIAGGTGGTTPTVVGNDTLNGQPVTVGPGGNSTLTPGTSPNPGIVMNPDGTITVAPGTPAGSYDYPYTICEVLNPTNCDTAIATVTVNAATIDAVDDNFAATPVNGAAGGTTATVITNDTLNGQPVTVGAGGNSTLTPGTSPNAGLTMNPDGTITVAPGTAAGTYLYPYTICEVLNPTNCDTATATVVVAAGTIVAVDDTPAPVNGATGGTTPTVVANDTLNGQPVTVGPGGNSTLTPGTSPNAGLTMNPNGTITVAPGTAAGTYLYPYTICEVLNPTNCDTAIATVTVNAATIDAVDDNFAATPVNGAAGGTTATVITNDTLNGQPVTVGAGGNSTLTPGTSPNAGLTMNPDGTITVAPGTAAGTYLYPYTICEVLNPTNCDTATATVVVAAGTIVAVDDTPAPVNGATGGTTPTVVGNDTLNGQPVTVGAGGNSTLTPGTSPNAGLTMNPDGTITVAPGTAAGTYLYPYTICEVLNPTNCDTATATVVVAAGTMVAVDDTPAPVNGATGGTTPTVVGNDTLNGQPVTVGAGGNSTLTPGTSPNPGIVMNPDGTITVAPGTPAGSYDYPYTICEVLNPTNCDTAIATVTVNAATIDAVDDNFAATPVNGAAGGTTATVITNDTLNGQPVTVGAGGNSTLTPGTSPNAGLTMNPDGTITVAPGTAAGTYLYPYTICEVLNPTNCDTATATVVVAAGTIVAVDDTPAPVNGATGGTTPTVVGNDTLNGQPVTVGAGGNSTLTPGTSPNPGIVMNPDGTITVAPGTPAGSYDYPYTICEVLNPTNCDTATATVVVAAGTIVAVDDTPAPVNGATGGTTPTVVANDTLNGQPVTVGPGGNSTLTPGTSPNPGIVMNPDGTITVAPGTPAGSYDYPYTICEVLNPTNCATAIATVVVGAGTIVANNDAPAPIVGGTGGTTPTVVGNDTLNGQPVTVGPGGNSTLTPGTSPNPGIVMNPDGTITVAPGTPAGSYDYPYTICEVLNPTNCATAIATVVVGAGTIVANNDAPAPIVGGTGGTTPTVVGNDTLNGQPVTVGPGGNSTLTPGTSPNPGIVMNPDGTITVAPGTPAGSYDYPYTICEVLNPTNCATAIATVVVGAGTIVANNDTPAPIAGGTGGTTPTVVGNDTLNGQPVTVGAGGNSTLTPGTSPNPGIVMNPDGTITVAPGTPAGSYDYPYTICEVLNPTNCATAIATVVVGAGTIVANNDAPAPIVGGTGGTTPTVVGNDTLNGQPVTVGPGGNSTLTPGTSPNPGIVMNPDGTITVAPGTPAGSYDYPYTICEVLNPTNCVTAIATVVVSAPVITVLPETTDPIDGGTGGTTPPVIGNDTLNGQPVTVGPGGNTTLTPGPSPNPGIAINPDGTITVAPGTPAGSYEVPYTLCEVLNPTNCGTGTATVVVTAPVIVALPDTVPPIDGNSGGRTPPVIGNDTLDGRPVTVGPGGNATLTPGASPNPGLTMNPDGTITIAPGTPAGTYTYPYTICDVVNPTNCATNTATLTIIAEPVTIRVVKTASPRDVKIGDLVRYTVSVQNIGTSPLVDGTLIDTPPAGFSYVNGSLDVVDRDAAGRLVGTSPIRVDQLDVVAGGRATITYLLRVGAGVRPGIHTNSALVQDDGASVSNTGTADVQLVSDPTLDESLILGTVFDDRDSDGWQDAGDLTGLRVQGGFAPGSYVAGSTTVDRGNGPAPQADASAPMLHGLELGTLAARQSDADTAAAHAVVISQVLTSATFTDDFALTSKQGVTVRMDAAGNTRVERSGDAAKGLTSADPTVTRRVSQVGNGYRVDYVIANNGVDERGIPGVRIASVEGLLVETDQFGRYNLIGIDGGSQERGRNFILKVDPATLPPGTVFTTDNPLVRRVTPGLPVRFDFGAKLPPGLVEGGTQAVELELGAVMFDADSAVIREAYAPVIDKMAGQVRGHVGAAEVVIAADGETQALAYDRAKAVQSALLAKLSPEDAAGLQVSLRADVEDPASTSVSLGRNPVLGTVLFDTDSAVIKPQYAALIDKLAADITAAKGGVVGVVGHADKRGSDSYNVALGLQRAKAVYEAIAARLDPQGRSSLRVEISDNPTAPVGIRGQ